MPQTPKMNQLPKMSIDMLNKADEFLEKDVINTRAGVRFIIEMMSEEFKALDAIIENQNAQRDFIIEQHREIESIKKKSIVLFVENHPKLSLAIALIAIVTINLLPLEYIRKVLFLTLGIPDPLP